MISYAVMYDIKIYTKYVFLLSVIKFIEALGSHTKIRLRYKNEL